MALVIIAYTSTPSTQETKPGVSVSCQPGVQGEFKVNLHMRNNDILPQNKSKQKLPQDEWFKILLLHISGGKSKIEILVALCSL